MYKNHSDTSAHHLCSPGSILPSKLFPQSLVPISGAFLTHELQYSVLVSNGLPVVSSLRYAEEVNRKRMTHEIKQATC